MGLTKPTRELFFARMAEIAPQFQRSSRYDIKGFTWTFTYRTGAVRQSIIFQRHKYEDAFTIDVAWSCLHDNPVEAPFGDPTTPFEQRGCRFRLGRFWEPQRDVWWYVAKPRYGVSLVELFKAFLPAADPQEASAMAVSDATTRIQQYALPYFERVTRAMA